MQAQLRTDPSQGAGVSSFGRYPQQAPGRAQVGELLREFKQRLASRGARGFVGLQRQFKIMDDNGNK